jgi:hypothetical protein
MSSGLPTPENRLSMPSAGDPACNITFFLPFINISPNKYLWTHPLERGNINVNVKTNVNAKISCLTRHAPKARGLLKLEKEKASRYTAARQERKREDADSTVPGQK